MAEDRLAPKDNSVARTLPPKTLNKLASEAATDYPEHARSVAAPEFRSSALFKLLVVKKKAILC
jgi:hypothetical protein